MHAVILAAGLGSRMSEITRSSPKSMIRIAGMTIFERLISSLKSAGLTRITVGCGWLADEIIDLIGEMESDNSLSYARVPNYQTGPLQTLVTLLEMVEEDTFLACPADYLVDSSLVSSFLSMSRQMKEASLCLAVDTEVGTGSNVYVREDKSLFHIGDQGQLPNDSLQVMGRSAMLLSGKTETKVEFRKLLEGGMSSVRAALNEIASTRSDVYPVPVHGFWKDIDNANDVISVIAKVIDETEPRSDAILVKSGDVIEFGDSLTLASGITIGGNVHLIGPTFIEESKIGSGSTIGPNVSIGKGTIVPSDCYIDNSILYLHPKLEQGSRITKMVAHSNGRIFGED
ncbi:MAG: NDP-sugar synthase [Candidatus Thorarchaeota archaeon]|nr:NDP-sugar synthase [Candidatus Thorarchaeota archaeon]